MYNSGGKMSNELDQIRAHKKQWLDDKNKKSKDRDAKFITASSNEVELLGTPDMLENFDFEYLP